MKTEHEEAINEALALVEVTMRVRERKLEKEFHAECKKYLRELFAARGRKYWGLVLTTIFPKKVVSLTLLRFIGRLTKHDLHTNYRIAEVYNSNGVVKYSVTDKKTQVKITIGGRIK